MKQRATLFLLTVFTHHSHKVGQFFHFPNQFPQRMRYWFKNNPVADPDYFKLDVHAVISDFCGDSNSL